MNEKSHEILKNKFIQQSTKEFKMKNLTLILSLITTFYSGIAFSGQYTQPGYIKEIKANIQGKECNIMIADSSGKAFQGGKWNCDSIMGQNVLSVAKLAKTLHLKVNVVLEGNGADYKPVYSINIIE